MPDTENNIATQPREESEPSGGESVPNAVYEAAVKGRQDFRQAYRDLLPLQRAAQELSDYWRTPGSSPGSDEMCALINAVDVAITGGGKTTPVMKAEIAGRRAVRTPPPTDALLEKAVAALQSIAATGDNRSVFKATEALDEIARERGK